MNIDAKRNQAGFNLVELMVVLLIVSVISALGGPALGDTVKRNHLRTEADRIITTLNLTRSEAVKRNQAVSIRRGLRPPPGRSRPEGIPRGRRNRPEQRSDGAAAPQGRL